jgi:hypothetical protein
VLVCFFPLTIPLLRLVASQHRRYSCAKKEKKNEKKRSTPAVGWLLRNIASLCFAVWRRLDDTDVIFFVSTP